MKKITKATYLKWYEDMLFWRKFEDKLAQVYIQQKVRGFLHLYNGQEAILAGALHAMDTDKDRMITAYRNHVQPIGLGVDPKRVMAELYGKGTGTSQGLGGSMHIFSKEHRFYGGHGIVGGQIPLGAGLAFADKYFKRDAVTLTFMGDGATRQGSLHETLTMAVNWNLPVVFCVENNGYAMGTSVARTARSTDIYKLGNGYEMPCAPVDAMDPEKVAEALDEAIARARKGEGPTLIESTVERLLPHTTDDDHSKYRRKDDIEGLSRMDPLPITAEKLISINVLSKSDIQMMEKEAKLIVDDATEKIGNEPYPGVETMLLHSDLEF